MRDVHLTVPGEPIGRERARSRVVTTKDGRTFASTYTPAKTRAEDGAIRLFGAQAMEGRPPLSGPLALQITAYRSVPTSWSKKKRDAALGGFILPTQKPDFDNYAKMVDALKGVVWVDDAQICDAHIMKRFSDRPRLVIWASQMERV